MPGRAGGARESPGGARAGLSRRLARGASAAAGYELGVSGNTDRDLRSAWTFSNQPRLSAVSAALNEGTAQNFTYGYVANSALLDGYTTTAAGAGAAFTISRDYEERRDLVTRLEAKWGTGTNSTRTRFDYTYDAQGRRRTAKQSGTAYADYTAGQSYSAVYNVYSYNARGELQTAAMYRGDTPTTSPSSGDELPGRRFEYRYDSAGNRQTAGATGSSSTDDLFTTNALNQYTERENNTVRVTGTAAGGANVLVLGATTNKTDRAWAADFVPANTSGPADGTATVYAALPGQGSGGADLVKVSTRDWLAAHAAQAFTYDDDGNLTSDGVWNYVWNAENQLVRMTATTAMVTIGQPNRKIEFAYDYAGRRVQKIVSDWNGTAWVPGTSTRFVYDGWNLLVELDSSGSAITRSYTWGLDNGGSLTSSSSPGSLLRITNYASGTPGTSYYPTYDDQGNVVSLVNATSGALAAVYEYDPYGNFIRNEVLDSAVADNPFKHSTKYHDVESGLVYYGYRYYDPKNGRFINRDPIGEAGGLNLYGFIGNSGVNGSDHLGMYWVYEYQGTVTYDITFTVWNNVSSAEFAPLYDAFSRGDSDADYRPGISDQIFWGAAVWENVYMQVPTTYTFTVTQKIYHIYWVDDEQPENPEGGDNGPGPGAGDGSSGGGTTGGGENTGGATGGTGTGNGTTTGGTDINTGGVTVVNPQPPAPASQGVLNSALPREQGLPGSKVSFVDEIRALPDGVRAADDMIYPTADDAAPRPSKPGSWLDDAQTALDMIGVLDPTPLSDGANAVIYAVRGQWGNAAISIGSMLPLVGDSFKILRYGEKIEEAAEGVLGVVYKRVNPKTGEEYIGKAKSPERFKARQGEHDRNLKEKHEYEPLGHAKPGTDLDVLEETMIRKHGGLQKEGGKLVNKRHEMREERYRKHGGTHP